MGEMKVAFIGHRKIQITPSLTGHIDLFLESLICEMGARHFIFGSKSQFNDLCYKHVTKWRGCVRSIVREYVRAEHEFLTDNYRAYLDERFEMTDYPYELSTIKITLLKKEGAAARRLPLNTQENKRNRY